MTENRTRSFITGVCIIAAMVLSNSFATANVEHKEQWIKGNYPATEVFHSPAPANAEARAQAFAQRNSPQELENLAKEFFALIDLNQIPSVRDIYRQGDYAGALDAYRDFFIDRLRFPPAEFQIEPRHPDARVFVEFLNDAEELMNNTVTFAVAKIELPRELFSDLNQRWEGKHVWQHIQEAPRFNLKINIGEPGGVNWLWAPKGYTNAGRHTGYLEKFPSGCYANPIFFGSLLSRYVETDNPEYLLKWAAFVDDQYRNLRRDCVEAGNELYPHFNAAEEYINGVLPHLCYLARRTPHVEKVLPAPTLARILLRIWKEYLPSSIRGGRQTVPNRQAHMYPVHGYVLGLSFPEFLPAQYGLRDKIRILEGYSAVAMQPDGSDAEDSRNYNKAYLYGAHLDLKGLSLMRNRPAWMTPMWWNELRLNRLLRARFLLHDIFPTGGHANWSPLRSQAELFTGRKNVYLDVIPEALADPENQKLISLHYGDGAQGEPSFTSECWPYAGFYYIRGGWGRDSQTLYLQSARPMASVTWRNNNSIALHAFGQPMLLFGSDTPIRVDGLEQIDCSSYRATPQAIQNQRFTPQYGKMHSATAYQQPRPHRWHQSERFNLTEGLYDGPFARTQPDEFINDVTHKRQIAFVRKEGLWVVVDRVESPAAHKYQLGWPLFGPQKSGKDWPGYNANAKQIVTDEAAQSIKTANPGIPNLSIYHFAEAPLKRCSELEGKSGSNLIVSALYPRKTMDVELKKIKRLEAAGGASGFEATTPQDGIVRCLAAPGTGELKLGDVAATAEFLLLTGDGHGMALGCKNLAINGGEISLPAADFEFNIAAPHHMTAIYRPMGMVEILPQADHFADTLAISMKHPEPGVRIHYTLDGTDPTLDSPVYETSLTVRDTTMVRAIAVRPGVKHLPPVGDSTLFSVVNYAIYTRETPRKAVSVGDSEPGLYYSYYEEGHWPISAIDLPVLKPVKEGTTDTLMDIADAKDATHGYGFDYSCFLNVPRDGVYTIHAPREFVSPSIDAGYDLRVYLNNEEWYPATRRHNYGNWSVVLAKGLHRFRVIYIDQRKARMFFKGENWLWDGEKPTLEISGPDLEQQPIPASMLMRSRRGRSDG